MNNVIPDLHFGIGVDNTNQIAKQRAKRKVIYSKFRKTYTLSSKTMISRENKKDKIKIYRIQLIKKFCILLRKKGALYKKPYIF